VEGNPSKATKGNLFGGAQRTRNLVFRFTLTPATDHMNIDGTSVPLSPGMSVFVEIKTGRRRILEYIFSPIVQSVMSAMKER
jgi:hemolysin D